MKTILISFLSLLCLLGCSSEEEYNYAGEFRSVKLEWTKCTDTSDNYNWPVEDEHKFCYDEGGFTICFELIVRIQADGTYERTFIDQKFNAQTLTSNPDKKTGTYTVNGADIDLCPSDGSACDKMFLNKEQTALIWSFPSTDDCTKTYTILRQ